MRKRATAATTQIDRLVQHFHENRSEVAFALGQIKGHIEEDKELRKFIHSVKWRVKDEEHLRDKLNRKMAACQEKGTQFIYTKENLFTEINDLAGLRILHLHTQQMEGLDRALKNRLDEARYKIIEGPIARSHLGRRN